MHASRGNSRFTVHLTGLSIDRHDHGHGTFISQLLSLAHRLAVDLHEPTVVDECASNLTLVDDRSALAIKLEHIAILDQNDVFFSIAEMVFDKLLVSKQHAILAMNWNNE